ncbi:TPA_asm: hypothetical protein [Tilapia adomavirus 2]|uniref:Uncharacterized protein n=1 Tax=Tilapia adomavirus 2 TaxID=2597804 RepID=A0A5H3CTC6_9VIRU|nr:TPA_asm: hypothetical protein [Tilapia adomavirus 2]
MSKHEHFSRYSVKLSLFSHCLYVVLFKHSQLSACAYFRRKTPKTCLSNRTNRCQVLRSPRKFQTCSAPPQ